MSAWPKYPVIYEINTWVWLGELSRTYNRSVTLATIPEREWETLVSHGCDAVWFMGVWERSAAGIAIANQNAGLLEDFRRALRDFQPEDNVGSPYCIRQYEVDRLLGGPEGLAIARNELALRGLRLILDFVPNHVAPDHPWAITNPEYFIRGDEEDLRLNPASFMALGGHVFACGRDPYFPAWPDVLQLNAFDPGLRSAALATVREISKQCDGIRCDMAMLMMNDIFERTWGADAGPKPAGDYWTTLITAVKETAPEFLFIAEAYWDLEWQLQQQGFDYCYDKKLYDRMEHGAAESVRQHLLGDMAYQLRLVRFLENHDEPRAAASFPDGKARAAAVAVLTLPGARLLHEGQFEGRKVRLPVFLTRRPAEPADHDLAGFYRHLLTAVNHDIFRNGEWQLCERKGWPDNQSFLNILSWCWVKGEERVLMIINYSAAPAQALVEIPWSELSGMMCRLTDVLSGSVYERRGDDMLDSGLYVDLGSWKYHFLWISPL